MSSILEALKKVEDEKRQEEGFANKSFEEVVAAETILTGRRGVDEARRQVYTYILVLVSLGMSLTLAIVTFFTIFFVLRKSPETGLNIVGADKTFQQVQISSSVASEPPSQPSSPVTVEQSGKNFSASEKLEMKPEELRGIPPKETMSTGLPLPQRKEMAKTDPVFDLTSDITDVPVEKFVAPPESRLPKPPMVTEKRSLPRASSSSELPNHAELQQPLESDSESRGSYIEDPSVLPILTPIEQERIGLPRLRVNFVSQASSSRPQPYALINYNKVYVGDTIPNTEAQLIGVSIQGIGIEIGGRKYFIPAR